MRNELYYYSKLGAYRVVEPPSLPVMKRLLTSDSDSTEQHVHLILAGSERGKWISIPRKHRQGVTVGELRTVGQGAHGDGMVNTEPSIHGFTAGMIVGESDTYDTPIQLRCRWTDLST